MKALRALAREAGEGEPGHQRNQHDGDESFDRGDRMRVQRLRVHVAVADGRTRLDAEEEQVVEVAEPRVGDRILAEPIEPGEHDIEGDEDAGDDGEEAGPAHRHRVVVEIGPEAVLQAISDDAPPGEGAQPRARLLAVQRLRQRQRQAG